MTDFVSLLFPKCCVICDDRLMTDEEFICITCLNDLPYTGYTVQNRNPVYALFDGKMDIENATALLHFETGNPTQKLIHQLKYRNNPEIGVFLGRLLGEEIKNAGSYGDLAAVIPVSLHKSKKVIRGYNQSEFIAEGIAESLKISLETDLVVRRIHSESQTRKGRYDRWKNVSNVFHCRDANRQLGKHFLIVDDVITTGATMEACAVAITGGIPDARISFATLARSA